MLRGKVNHYGEHGERRRISYSSCFLGYGDIVSGPYPVGLLFSASPLGKDLIAQVAEEKKAGGGLC